MDYKIKVIVSEMPSKNKLADLINLAKESTALATTIKTECKEIAEQVGKAKYDVIMKQLYPIVEAVAELAKLAGRNEYCNFSHYVEGFTYGYRLYIQSDRTGNCTIRYGNPNTGFEYLFDKDDNDLYSPCGIITHWSELDVIQSLENIVVKMYKQYNDELAEQVKSAEDARDAMLR